MGSLQQLGNPNDDALLSPFLPTLWSLSAQNAPHRCACGVDCGIPPWLIFADCRLSFRNTRHSLGPIARLATVGKEQSSRFATFHRFPIRRVLGGENKAAITGTGIVEEKETEEETVGLQIKLYTEEEEKRSLSGILKARSKPCQVWEVYIWRVGPGGGRAKAAAFRRARVALVTTPACGVYEGAELRAAGPRGGW